MRCAHRFRRASGVAVDDDAALVAILDGQARRPIVMRRTASHVPVCRCAAPPRGLGRTRRRSSRPPDREQERTLSGGCAPRAPRTRAASQTALARRGRRHRRRFEPVLGLGRRRRVGLCERATGRDLAHAGETRSGVKVYSAATPAFSTSSAYAKRSQSASYVALLCAARCARATPRRLSGRAPALRAGQAGRSLRRRRATCREVNPVRFGRRGDRPSCDSFGNGLRSDHEVNEHRGRTPRLRRPNE